MKFRFAMRFQNKESMEDHVDIIPFDTSLFPSYYQGGKDLKKMTPARIAADLGKIFQHKDWPCTGSVGFVVNDIVWDATLSVAEFQRQHPEITIENSVIYMPQSVKNEHDQYAFFISDYPFAEFNGINIEEFCKKHPDIEINYQNPLFVHHLLMDGYVYMRSFKKREHELVTRRDEFDKTYITWQLITDPSYLSIAVSATRSSLHAAGSALSSFASWGSSFFVRPSTNNSQRSSKFFSNADFSGLTFKKIDFASAHLKSADFSNAKIHQGDFFNADVRFANFSDSEIHQINFSDADLRFTDFRNCAYSNLKFNEKTLLIGHDLPTQEKLSAEFCKKLDEQISRKIKDSTLQQESIDYFQKMLERMRNAATGEHGSPAKLFFLVQQWAYKESSTKRKTGFITGIFKEILVNYYHSTHDAVAQLKKISCNSFTHSLQKESALSHLHYATQCLNHYEAVTTECKNSVFAR